MMLALSIHTLVHLSIQYFFFFRDTPTAQGGSQARVPIGAAVYSCWLTPQLQQYHIGAASVTYTTAHGNSRSLTH